MSCPIKSPHSPLILTYLILSPERGERWATRESNSTEWNCSGTRRCMAPRWESLWDSTRNKTEMKSWKLGFVPFRFCFCPWIEAHNRVLGSSVDRVALITADRDNEVINLEFSSESIRIISTKRFQEREREREDTQRNIVREIKVSMTKRLEDLRIDGNICSSVHV